MKKKQLIIGLLSTTLFSMSSLMTSTTTEAATKWGAYHNYGHHISIVKKGYGIYQDKAFKKKVSTTDKKYHKTYYGRGYYNLSDGSRYISLFDNNNHWIGYVRSSALKVAETRGGIPYTMNKTMKVVKKGYPLWKEFTFKTKKGSTDSYYNKKVYVKPYYNHFNQQTYYSVYTSSTGKWLGYVNKTAIGKLSSTSGNQQISQDLNAQQVNKAYQESLSKDYGWKGQWMDSKKGFDNADIMDTQQGYAEVSGGKGALNNKTAGQHMAHSTNLEKDVNEYHNYKYGYTNTTVKNDKLGSSAHTDYYFWN